MGIQYYPSRAVEIPSTVSSDIASKVSFNQTVSDKSANYTLLPNDQGSLIRSSGGAITIFVADILENGQQIDFIQAGVGQITFSGVNNLNIYSVDNKLKTSKQNAGATLKKVSGNYYLIGNLG